MKAILSLGFIIFFIMFFVWKNNDKKELGKIQEKTWIVLAVSLFSLLMFFILPTHSNDEKIHKETTKTKSTISSESPKSSSSIQSSSSSSEYGTTSDLTELNDWFQNKYTDEQTAAYQADGNEYFGSPEYIKAMVFKGFTVESGELTAVINNNQLKAENLTQKEVANFAFNVILPDYKGKLPKFKNTNDDGSLKDDVLRNPQYYSTLE